MDDYEYEYEYEYGYKYICIENLFLKYKYCNLKINLSNKNNFIYNNKNNL